MAQIDESTVFRQLNDSLDMAASSARQLVLLRDDIRWDTIANLLIEMKSKTFELRLRSLQSTDREVKK
jgi:hypothetical protein